MSSTSSSSNPYPNPNPNPYPSPNPNKAGEWKSVIDLLFLSAMLHPGGGKNDIPNRAKRHFHVMNVTLPSAASINQIFGSMISAKFSPSDPDKNAAVWEAASKLVEMTIDIWDKTKTKMLPTPAKFHYIFNLRDLSRVFQGIFTAPLTNPNPNPYPYPYPYPYP